MIKKDLTCSFTNSFYRLTFNNYRSTKGCKNDQGSYCLKMRSVTHYANNGKARGKYITGKPTFPEPTNALSSGWAMPLQCYPLPAVFRNYKTVLSYKLCRQEPTGALNMALSDWRVIWLSQQQCTLSRDKISAQSTDKNLDTYHTSHIHLSKAETEANSSLNYIP